MLLPLLGAVVNGIQAIDARYGDDLGRGPLRVQVERAPQEAFDLSPSGPGRVPLKPIIDDCAAVLEQTDRAVVGDELGFALDWLGAMPAGHSRSAQAMFTVTLVKLIYRFYPDQAARRLITNRKKGDDVSRYYSRHASVHGVSSRQFSKRNCVQVPMLVTSLIGYANWILTRTI